MQQEIMHVEDLLSQYKETLKSTNDQLEELLIVIEPFRNIYENHSLSESERLEAKNAASPVLEDIAIIRSWKSNLEFCISWMKTGRRPGSTRGIERRAAYEREKSFDPMIMQRFFRSEENIYSWDSETKEDVVSLFDKERIEEALSVLTDREREIYLMAKGNSLSYGKIAELLCIGKSTVSTNIYRAEKKMRKHLAKEKGVVQL